MPFETINLLFSFFGHIGVQLFIFISGYGLCRSYMLKPVRFPVFMKKRIKKLFPFLFIGVLMLTVYLGITYRFMPDYNWIRSLLYKLFMVHTLIPNEALSMVGPWWFFGLIMQLYLLFIPLYYVIKRWGFKGFMVVLIISYILIFSLYQPLLSRDVFIMANAPGHLPELALGIFLALNPKFKVHKPYYPFLLVLFVVGNFNFYAFPFTFIISTYFLIILILKVFEEEHFFSNTIRFYGKLSLFLFITHGFIRNPLFVNSANIADNPFATMLLGIMYLAFATLVAFVARKVYRICKEKVYSFWSYVSISGLTLLVLLNLAQTIYHS